MTNSEHFQTLIDWFPEAIGIHRQGLLVHMNPAGLRLIGAPDLESVLGRPVLDWVHPDSRPVAAGRIDSPRGQTVFRGLLEEKFVRTDGAVIDVEVQNNLIEYQGDPAVFVVFRDITARKRTEELIRNSQKMDALGVLAGGIAHDFNNLLTGLYGHVELARSSVPNGQASELLDQVLATRARARGLTHQLMTFAKGGAPKTVTARLEPFLRETAGFNLTGYPVLCRFLLAPNLWACPFDRAQLGQLVDNLTINARQAMDQGGTLEISGTNLVLGPGDHPVLAPGPYVRLDFKDGGPGIEPGVLPRIFDPFFTTKAQGQGLGLATCFSVARRHGGTLEVQSVPGRGTTFSVYLPADPTFDGSGGRSSGDHPAQGTILVMDDDGFARTTTAAMVKGLGYGVLTAGDGLEALTILDKELEAGRRPAALVFDLTVPGGMGGKEAVAEVRKRSADLPVFVVSGYSDDPVLAWPRDYGFTDSLSKPFSRDDLSRLFRKHRTQEV